VKRSVLVAGHKTSISLEEAFWTGLKQIADSQKIPIQEMVSRIDGQREQGNLSSAVRLFVLEHYRSRARTIGVATEQAAQSP
jgi:predicted DNA-binding ribbon-helix-helix protein